jgi:hypothetical protein
MTWSILNHAHGALFMLFAALLGLVQGDNLRELNPYAYMHSFRPTNLKFAIIDSDGPELFPEVKIPLAGISDS